MKFIRDLIPRGVKMWLGSHMAARQSRAQHRILCTKDIRLQQRHVHGCQLLVDREMLLSCLPKDAVVAEIGVAEGHFSRRILQHARPRMLHLVDLWNGVRPGYDADEFGKVTREFGSPDLAGRITIHRGISWDVIAGLPEHSLDWIYLDAGHSYDAVKRDLAAAMRAVKPDGYIAGHDYVRWSSPNGRFGVVEAVNELCRDHGYVFRYLTLEPNMHLSYALQRQLP